MGSSPIADGMAWKAVDEAQEKSWSGPGNPVGEPGCSQRLRSGRAGWVLSFFNGLILYSPKR